MHTHTTPTHTVWHSSQNDSTEQSPLHKTHLVPMVALPQSGIYSQKNNFGEFKFQTVKNIVTTASTYNGSLYLLMNKAC